MKTQGLKISCATCSGSQPSRRNGNAQSRLFQQGLRRDASISLGPRRHQNRKEPPLPLDRKALFDNEADTDFSLQANREWVKEIIHTWKKKKFDPIPLSSQDKNSTKKTPAAYGNDPRGLKIISIPISMADWRGGSRPLKDGQSRGARMGSTSVEDRCALLGQCAQKMREGRGDLIGVMMADGGKTALESDPEISEAIDFADYYLRSMMKMDACKDLSWKPKGTVLVAPPWNFPISIPAGGILGALAAGNCVLFKPAPEAVLSGWVLVQHAMEGRNS